MSVYFLLIYLTNISYSKPAVIPLTEGPPEQYLTISDLKDFKILALTIIVMGGINLIRFVWSFFSSERRDLSSRVDHLDDTTTEINHKIDKLILTVAQLKDAQISESGIRSITRDEIHYVERIRNKP